MIKTLIIPRKELIRPDKELELMTIIRYHPFLANNSENG